MKYSLWHIRNYKDFTASAIQPSMYESTNEPKTLAANSGNVTGASFPVVHYLESEPF